MVKNFPTAHINLNEKLKTHSIISERFPLKKNWFLFFLYILINAGIYVVGIYVVAFLTTKRQQAKYQSVLYSKLSCFPLSFYLAAARRIAILKIKS